MTDIYGYAAAAPLYRAAGWMQVIPLPEGRKTPPPSGFTGRSRKPVTDEQVRFWSQSDPTANTGIVIPEGVLVLDIDAEQGHQVKADGAKGISELSQELGALPATWSSTTHGIDSPARHLFYKVPEGLAWKGGAIEGVDILQPGHRYSVVWPSIHPSGEMYCWYTPSGSTTSQIPHISDLATLPWKWVDYLRKPEHTTPRPTSNTLISPETGTYDARICKAVNTFYTKHCQTRPTKAQGTTPPCRPYGRSSTSRRKATGARSTPSASSNHDSSKRSPPTARARNARPHANGPAFSAARWRRSTAYKRTRTHASSRR